MEGIELAETLLYRDCEAPRHHNRIRSNCFEYIPNQSNLHKLIVTGGYENNCNINSMLVPGIYQGSSNLGNGEFDNCFSFGATSYDTSWLDSDVLRKTIENFGPVAKSNISTENGYVQEMENSSAYFRPISTNICEELNQMKFNNLINKADVSLYQISKCKDTYNGTTNEKSNVEQPIRKSSNVQNIYNMINKEKELELNNATSVSNQSSKNLKVLYFSDQGSFSKNNSVKTPGVQSDLLLLDTLNSKNVELNAKSSLITSNSYFPSNSSLICYSEVAKDTSGQNIFETTSTCGTQANSSISSLFETGPACNVVPKTIGATISIPQGSYIFIPFSVPNISVNKMKHNNVNVSVADALPIGNNHNKYMLGCYPVISQLQDTSKVPGKQLPPIIVPQQPFTHNNSNTTLTVNDLTGTTEISPHFLAPYIPMVEPIVTKSSKKKTESTELNYYLNVITESHKMLVKEKNKITLDRSVIKDDNLKNVINYATRNNNIMNKLEKELNSLINSLFEINVLISKIESLRAISFVESFYNFLQNTAELIQSFHTKDIFPQYFQRDPNVNKRNDKSSEVQLDKLKRLLYNIQQIRSFLWAAYSNLLLDRERQLSCSLTKLKSWCEMKKNLRHSFKLNESNIKTRMSSSNMSNVETTISYQDVHLNSARPVMKIERNSLPVQTQSFAIPVTQFHTIPNHMTTLVQRFPNQQSSNISQYNYIQTSLSNFGNPTLINSNNFPLVSNCRLSYGSQQQIYASTQLNGAHPSNLPPRNFLIASSSLMTPIIYQNSTRPIISSTPLNFMLYKANPQII